MTSRMMKHWCDEHGKPDFRKMAEVMEHQERSSRFEAIGWALFFIWIGIAWLADVGLGIGLLGVAAVTLGMQAARKFFGEAVEGFWVFVGLGFAAAGLWQWLDVQLPLAPLVLIAIGIALFYSRVWPRSPGEK